eukprot:8021224-Lingulodinium_polyedra.AAC.1
MDRASRDSCLLSAPTTRAACDSTRTASAPIFLRACAGPRACPPNTAETAAACAAACGQRGAPG